MPHHNQWQLVAGGEVGVHVALNIYHLGAGVANKRGPMIATMGSGGMVVFFLLKAYDLFFFQNLLYFCLFMGG